MGSLRDVRHVIRATRSGLVALVAVCLLVPATSARADDSATTPTATSAPAPTADGEPAPPAEPPVEPPAEPPVEPPAEPPVEPPAEPQVEPPVEPPAEPPVTPPAGNPPSRLPLRAGAHGWRVKIAQDRLSWLGYRITPASRSAQRMGETTVAAVAAFQRKFGYRPTGVIGPGTWDLLAAKAGRIGQLPRACGAGRVVCVDKDTRLVRLVEDGTVRITLDARFGFPGAATREGAFRVSRKSRDHVSSLYRTWMPFAMFFSGGQAVHYSPYFARDGYNGGSHGCVNLRDFAGARWLFDHVPLGTPVYVYRSGR